VRLWLVIGGILAAALGIALWLLVRDSDDATAGSSAPSAERREPATTPDRPALPHQRTATGSATPSRDYAVGDHVIRDHRTGDQVTRTEPPTEHARPTRLLPASLTKAISQKVLAVMNDCTAAIPADARVAKARLDGDLTVAIKDHSLTVAKVAVALGVTGPALDVAKQCIEERAVGLTTAAADEADLDNYKINVSFRLP
jgi:hypothetical protein